jgi:DUF1365 family protein
MDLDYDWQFVCPGDRLSVHMDSRREGERVFEAALSLERRPMTGLELARALVSYPAMTTKVFVGIYFQALRLWLRRAEFHPHPRIDSEEAP